VSETDTYEILRQWQLARLRNLARQEAAKTMATPATLITADRQAIRDLIILDAASPTQSTPASKQHNIWPWLAGGWILVQSTILVLYALEMHDPGRAVKAWFESTIVTAIPGLATVSTSETFLERVSFAAFYLVPLLMVLAVPGKFFTGAGTSLFKRRSFIAQLIVMSAGSTIFLLFMWYLFAVPTTSSTPESLALVPETATASVKPAVAWCAIIFSVILIAFKTRLAEEARCRGAAEELQKLCGVNAPPRSDLHSSIAGLRDTVLELRQREMSIADYASAVIACFDENLVIEAISPSALAQWGYFQVELMGQTITSITFADDQEAVSRLVRVSEGRKPIEFDSRIRKSDKSIIDVHWYIEWSPQYKKFFACAEDITDRMNFERAKRTFVAQLAHDMRSPLSAVNLTLSALGGGALCELPQEATRMVSRSKAGLSRVLDLINEILESERLHNRNAKLAMGAFSLQELCQGIADELKSLSTERKVQVNILCEEITVLADRALVSRAVANLLSNAISFAPKNTVVGISCSKHADSAIVKISDHGPGIPVDYHRLIFERFGMNKRRDASDRISTGLGLAICRDIITAHGGMIGVESEPGAGSTFWFTLPIASKH
jgi:PAS domain S-box-containing protein